MKTLKTLALVGALATGSSAMATLISGDIQFTQDLNTTATVFGNSFVSATEVDISPASPNNNAHVSHATLDFAGLLGQETSIPNLTVGTDIPNFWSVGGFSFELKNSANISTTESFLNITGDGIISGPAGFDATPGTFSLTATRTGDNIITFGFLADTTAVPDGGATAMLIGAGLLGLGALRRKVS